MMKPLRRPLRGRPLAGSWLGRDLWRGAKGFASGDGAIRPGTAQMTWAGYAPLTVSGVGWSVSPGVGQATWSGLQPDVQVPVSFSPGVAAMSWTGPAPTIAGLYEPPPLTNIKGYWDVSVLSSLYQERTGGGTTPAVVDGVVGTIRDLSGNGFHLAAPTDAGRGILRQSGSEYYIELDGTDDAYLANWTQISQPNTFCLAWRRATTATGWIVGPYDGTYRNELYHASGNFRMFPPGNNITTSSDNTQYVQTAIFNGASGNLRTNGVASSAQDTSTTQWSGVSVGAFTGTSNWTVMRFYALAAYDGLVSGGDLTDLEAWAASKNGVSL